MKKGWLIGLGVVGFGFVIVVISLLSVWSHRNTAVALEEQIKAQHVANKSNYDNMWKSFKEAAQVTDKQADQFKDVYNDMIAGRYQGDDQVLFKMIQEQNPSLGTEVYTQLQNLIIAGRKEFDNNQKKIADIIREYNTYIRKHIIMNAIFNFKALDANDYIVTSERTEKAFDSGKDDSINLNQQE